MARRLRENASQDSPRPALEVIQAASREVRGSVVYATVIVCVVLVPVLLLPGIAGRIFSPLAQAYVLAILASLAVALTVTPALCAVLLPRLDAKTARTTRLAAWLIGVYERILRRAVRRPRFVLVPAGLLSGAAMATLPLLGGRFLPEFHEGALIAHVHAAPGTSLSESMALVNRVDASLRPGSAVHVASRVGSAELDEDAARPERCPARARRAPDRNRRVCLWRDPLGCRREARARALDARASPGYHIEVGGEAKECSKAATHLVLVGILVLIAIFAFLASAFQSGRDAAIVLLNIPLGLVGGVVAAVASPEGLSVAGFVGFVTLFGIIARNGILLVTDKRHLDAEHPDVEPVERVLRAASERLLPIIMTAATAGLGLLPLALSMESAGSEIEGPMALIVCAGLVTSTALNLIVLPTAYVALARRGRSSEASSP